MNDDTHHTILSADTVSTMVTILLLVTVIYAWTDGYFNHTTYTVIEQCNGQAVNIYNITKEEFKEITEEETPWKTKQYPINQYPVGNGSDFVVWNLSQ